MNKVIFASFFDGFPVVERVRARNRPFSRCDGRCPKYRGRAWKRGIFGQECNQTNHFHRKKMIKAPYFVRYCLSTKNSSVSPVSLRCQQCISRL